MPSNYTFSDVVKSFVLQAKYDAKQDQFQQGAVTEYLAETLSEHKPINGMELTTGPVITLAQAITGSFTEEEKTLKNAAMSMLRVRISRAWNAKGEDGKPIYSQSLSLSTGVKMATKTKADRLEFKAKKPTEETTLREVVYQLCSDHGPETIKRLVGEWEAEQYSKEVTATK